MRGICKLLSCIILITLVSACTPSNNTTVDIDSIKMGGILTNSDDFNDEDREMIGNLLEMDVLSLDSNGRFNPDETVSTTEINLALKNFVSALNEKYGLAFPTESIPQVRGDSKFKSAQIELGTTAYAANIISESTSIAELSEAIQDYIKSIDQDDMLDAVLQGKIKSSLPHFDWDDDHLLHKIEYLNINSTTIITKAYFFALIKSWYEDIHNWILEYTVLLNGTGNYSARYALYDGKNYYYIAPYATTDAATGSKKIQTGIFKESNGQASELVVLQGAGGNLFSYGDYIYYTEGSSTKNFSSVFYRVNKNGKMAKERLAYNISEIYIDSATTGDAVLYYRKSDTGDQKIYSISLAKVHSQKTFEDNSVLAYEGDLKTLFIKNDCIYSDMLYDDNNKNLVVGRQNIKNGEKTYIYNDGLFNDETDVKLADNNLFILTHNSLGATFGGDSIIKIKDEANGHNETILDGVPSAWGSMEDRFNIKRLNPYNGYIYFFRRPHAENTSILCRIDYNGENAADIAEVNSNIVNLSFVLAGDYVFALNTNTSPNYKEIFRININDGSVNNSFLPNDVSHITTDTNSFDIFINAGGIKGVQGTVVEQIFFAHGEYKEILNIDLNKDGQEEMIVTYNHEKTDTHEKDGAIDVFALIDNKVQNVHTFFGGSKLANYALEQKGIDYYIKGIGGVSGGRYFTIYKFNGYTFEEIDSFSKDHTTYLVKQQEATPTDYNNKLDEYNNRCIATTNEEYTVITEGMKVDTSVPIETISPTEAPKPTETLILTEAPTPSPETSTKRDPWYPTCPSCGNTDMFVDPNTGLYMCRHCDYIEPDYDRVFKCHNCSSYNIHCLEKSGYIYAKCYDCESVSKYSK